jgi:hypothetical protein
MLHNFCFNYLLTFTISLLIQILKCLDFILFERTAASKCRLRRSPAWLSAILVCFLYSIDISCASKRARAAAQRRSGRRFWCAKRGVGASARGAGMQRIWYSVSRRRLWRRAACGRSAVAGGAVPPLRLYLYRADFSLKFHIRSHEFDCFSYFY